MDGPKAIVELEKQIKEIVEKAKCQKKILQFD
jgi:hypothetical protein